MLVNQTNSSLWPCLQWVHLVTFSSRNTECSLCRVGAVIIFCLSIICLIFNIRYFVWYQQQTRCRNTLVLSLFVTSCLILIVSVPSVVLQLFTCQRHCHDIYCRIEGFTSYFGGCLCMLIYMTLSIHRYLLLRQYKYRFFDRYITIGCWIVSLIWTFPPVFHYWTSYVPEGLGFHCSINWNDRSKINIYYILCSFIGIYFIPLIILLVVNVRVHQIIRSIYSFPHFYYHNQEMSEYKRFSSFKRRSFVFHQESDHRSKINSCYIQKAIDRQRFRTEYRFIKAIIFLVSAYIIAWTPYSIIALLQLFHLNFILNYPSFITLSAFIAKLSVIFAPIVYLSIMNARLFRRILF